MMILKIIYNQIKMKYKYIIIYIIFIIIKTNSFIKK